MVTNRRSAYNQHGSERPTRGELRATTKDSRAIRTEYGSLEILANAKKLVFRPPRPVPEIESNRRRHTTPSSLKSKTRPMLNVTKAALEAVANRWIPKIGLGVFAVSLAGTGAVAIRQNTYSWAGGRALHLHEGHR